MSDTPTSFVDCNTRDRVRERMLAIVNDSTGIKATELVTTITVSLVDQESKHYIEGNKSLKQRCELSDALHEIMEDLIRSGDILEMEYVLPTSNYKARSMFFPKGTEFTYPAK